MARKDLLSRLADAGEEAIGRLGKAPGMEQMVGFANSTRERLDELTKRVRGIEQLEQRVARLEKRVEELSGAKRSRSTARKPAARKPSGSTAKTGGSSPG